MPKQTKAKTTETPIETAPVVVKKSSKKTSAVVAPVVELSQPVASTETKPKSKAKKAKAEDVVSASVKDQVVTDEVVVAVAPAGDENIDVVLNDLSTEFYGKIQQLTSLVSSLKSDYRVLEKKFQREIKINQKKNSKRKIKAGTRAPSGFVKPTRISDELANFLDKPTGSEMARTEVTRDINKYIRSNSLQDKDNGRKINPDAKLATLLKLNETDELTYFNLQKYMSPHFTKTIKEVVAVATA